MIPVVMIALTAAGIAAQAHKDNKSRKQSEAEQSKSLAEAKQKAEEQLKAAKDEAMRKIAQDYVNKIQRQIAMQHAMNVLETASIAAGIVSLTYLGYLGYRRLKK